MADVEGSDYLQVSERNSEQGNLIKQKEREEMLLFGSKSRHVQRISLGPT